MIPETINQIDSAFVKFPFSVVNSYYKYINEIGFYQFNGVGNNCPYDKVNAIFRVYPKGQNPLSTNKTK